MSNSNNFSLQFAWALASLSLSLVGCSSKDSANNGGQSNGVCTQGATRECLGPAACKGAQICQADFTWTSCDCGPSGTGGSAGTTGGSATSDTSPSTSNTAMGGAGGGAAATGGVTSSVGTGGATSGETGGHTSAATGGTVSTPATGGATSAATGGTSSSAGTGGTTPAGGAAAGGSSSSPYLVADSGWISDPAHGLQGPLFTYADSGGSNITPNCDTGTCFNATGKITQFCVTGQVAKALDSSGYSCELTSDLCNWTKYWGATLAINANQAVAATTPSAWDASKYTGLSFAITVNTQPPNLRVYLNLVDGSQFCYQFTATKTYSLTWSQFKTNCYTTGGTAPTAANLTQVQSIAWQSGTNASQTGFFDFCVDQVKILP